MHTHYTTFVTHMQSMMAKAWFFGSVSEAQV